MSGIERGCYRVMEGVPSRVCPEEGARQTPPPPEMATGAVDTHPTRMR